jgi:hypothetical protein
LIWQRLFAPMGGACPRRCGVVRRAAHPRPRLSASVFAVLGAALLGRTAAAAEEGASLALSDSPGTPAAGEFMAVKDRSAVSAICPAPVWNATRGAYVWPQRPDLQCPALEVPGAGGAWCKRRGYLFGISRASLNLSAVEVGASRRLCACVAAWLCSPAPAVQLCASSPTLTAAPRPVLAAPPAVEAPPWPL